MGQDTDDLHHVKELSDGAQASSMSCLNTLNLRTTMFSRPAERSF